MTWKGKKVVVTGAAGFIGSHLAERLVREGAAVRAFDLYNSRGSMGWLDSSPLRKDMACFLGDVCDRDSLREAMTSCDTVFHLAALIAIPYSYHAPESYVRTNVLGTLNVLQLARDLHLSRVVHTSTSEVYGTACYVPIDEKHPLQGQSPYAASKIGADKMAEAFHLSFQLPVVTVRPFNTFGPRQSARAVIPTIITQCLSGKTVRLGSLHPLRDLNFVDNTVDGFLLAAASESALGKTINFGSGREISVKDLADLIFRIAGKSVPIESVQERVRPEGSEVERLMADHALATSLLGWEPKVGLEAGLAKTIEWMKNNLETYRPADYVL